ncbi:uncharacterized protein SPPG_08642 [Spizellomyces punctatus DAOM BR117]|uniref:Calponin-homology (CH) domain-containing protein n=1 Tax=Spizellomyces punctatus (strain DAOM BR117) TaxID=645134 RepID=A0A0L0H4B9_SPIPD|nr:uncharacterized protein SPPG_08642 [Spizellomyces punctatus DAOM BR117]KNC96047.1 hypothetical protein SPPG_08642 [Spizellomyces punctatus DAOM BR117]|eukprot:XP_016604087.1 hypothetical protein SPPG_08642 [Spizellomyces punctatus DAOM BR117]
MSLQASRYPSAQLSAATERLKKVVASYEAHEKNPSSALIRSAYAATDDVESYGRALTGLTENTTHIVDDRLVRSLKTSFRDAVGRADAALRRELDKLVNIVLDEVRFVYEADGADDANSDDLGEGAVESCRQALQEIAHRMDLVGGLDALLNDFITTTFRNDVHDTYLGMIETANAATEDRLSARIQRVTNKLEVTQSTTSQPSATAPRPHPVSAPQRTATQVKTNPSPPPVVPRPAADTAVSRPYSASEAVPPPQPPPLTKPRPKSIAVNQGPSTTSRLPPPIERSPVAKSRQSLTDLTPDEAEEMDVEETEGGNPPGDGRTGFVSNLNRMLSGPPPKFNRPAVQYSAQDEAGSDDDQYNPRSLTREVTQEPQDVQSEQDYPQMEDEPAETHAIPPAAVVPGQQPPAAPARVPTVTSMPEQSLAPPQQMSSSVSDQNVAGKEKDKHKGQKSPKMGIRGMLSHLTKSRPKKGKKSGKDDETGEHEPHASESTEPSHPSEEAGAEVDHPPVAVPPRPAARPPVQAREEEPYEDSTRGHEKSQSSTSSRSSKPTHSRPGSIGASLPGVTDQIAQSGEQHASDDGYTEAPAGGPERPPAVPSRPKKPQGNSAMSALASVMRGNQKTGDETASEADETASIASGRGNRMSMYSDSGASAGRPTSMYSEAGDRRSVHQDTPSEESIGRFPPRVAPSTPIRRGTYDEPQSPGSPPVGTIEPPAPVPRRPPRPVPSHSPMRKSTADDHSPSPPLPNVPPKPGATRKSTHFDEVPAEVRPMPPGTAQRPTSMASERPMSVVSTVSATDSVPGHEEPSSTAVEDHGEAPSPKPRRIPGLFATNHGALGALAAAVTGRSGPPAFPRSLSQDDHIAEEHVADGAGTPPPEEVLPAPLQTRPGDQDTQAEPAVVSPTTRRVAAAGRSPSHTDLFNGPALNFKRKESSVSGDDKAIEKGGLEWLNKHLVAHDIQVDNLYSALGNGLNLIYALEDCTGESVGKYNKRAMLPVHKIDNIAVALNFLTKKGISTGFCSPQDIMDGDRGKILTLFNYILKTFPA